MNILSKIINSIGNEHMHGWIHIVYANLIFFSQHAPRKIQ